MKNLTSNIAKLLSAAVILATASMANAGTQVKVGVETVADNYLYESLIQTEFDLDNQMQASVESSSNAVFQQALMAMKTDSAQQEAEKELAE